MTKWTPGPWFVINEGSKNEPMMSVKAARISGRPPKHCVAICATGDSPQEMEDANALLIAAAPDLYEATQFVERQPSLVSDKEVFPDHAQVSFQLSAGEIRKLINARKKAEGLA
jgi:hypothetical protein